jgi:hypothetical protein
VSAAEADRACQVVIAPSSPGDRLVADTPDAGRVSIGTNGEIRLTYAELEALIDEAVREGLGLEAAQQPSSGV